MPYDIWPSCIVHTTKDLRYLLNIYRGINTWTLLFRFHLHCFDLFVAGTYIIKDLDSESCSFSRLGFGLEASGLGLD